MRSKQQIQACRDFGEAVSAIRRAHSITQTEFANILGETQAGVSAVETGTKLPWTVGRLMRLRGKLPVKLSTLCELSILARGSIEIGLGDVTLAELRVLVSFALSGDEL
jgi:transcriptional regulator with XRE-family HTH domain